MYKTKDDLDFNNRTLIVKLELDNKTAAMKAVPRRKIESSIMTESTSSCSMIAVRTLTSINLTLP